MTREYRHGDPMRRVHWAATARHGQLMVRQEESVTTPEATIVLDSRLSAYATGLAATFADARTGRTAPRTGDQRQLRMDGGGRHVHRRPPGGAELLAARCWTAKATPASTAPAPRRGRGGKLRGLGRTGGRGGCVGGHRADRPRRARCRRVRRRRGEPLARNCWTGCPRTASAGR